MQIVLKTMFRAWLTLAIATLLISCSESGSSTQSNAALISVWNSEPAASLLRTEHAVTLADGSYHQSGFYLPIYKQIDWIDEQGVQVAVLMTSENDHAFIVFAGTYEWIDWHTNFDYLPANFSTSGGSVARGFQNSISTVKLKLQSIMHRVNGLFPNVRWTIIGHSKGAAEAAIFALQARAANEFPINEGYFFGTPQFANAAAAISFADQPGFYFVRTELDPVANLNVPAYSPWPQEFVFARDPNMAVQYGSETIESHFLDAYRYYVRLARSQGYVLGDNPAIRKHETPVLGYTVNTLPH